MGNSQSSSFIVGNSDGHFNILEAASETDALQTWIEAQSDRPFIRRARGERIYTAYYIVAEYTGAAKEIYDNNSKLAGLFVLLSECNSEQEAVFWEAQYSPQPVSTDWLTAYYNRM